MDPNVLNPESPVLKQSEGMWQKYCIILLWKLAGTERVDISAADIQALQNKFSPDYPTLLTHGMVDGIGFQLIDSKAAAAIDAYDKTFKGFA